MFLQVSATFFLECGELKDEGADLTLQSVCNHVSRALIAKSETFFANQEDGLEVWRARVSQELFGDPRPPAEFFWPHGHQYSSEHILNELTSEIILPAAAPTLFIHPFRPLQMRTVFANPFRQSPSQRTDYQLFQ